MLAVITYLSLDHRANMKRSKPVVWAVGLGLLLVAVAAKVRSARFIFMC